MGRAWIAVASAAHVRVGRAAGFMQVCHGKVAPLRRIHPGDRIIYYSPTDVFRGRERLQAFTAIGVALDKDPYQVEMDPDFRPWRRDVAWCGAQEFPIKPLLPVLDFTRGGQNWGYQLRFGLFSVTGDDAGRIADAMQAAEPRLLCNAGEVP